MKDELLLIIHDALDSTGKYPTTGNSMTTLKDFITKRVQQKYPNHQWSAIFEYGSIMICHVSSTNVLAGDIDDTRFTLFTPYTT